LVRNPYGRRLKSGEVGLHLQGVHGVIAGTEPYNAETLAGADQLKVIARVGIGLDSVDLDYCRSRGIQVTYTPEAPSDGVAELTVANIINLLRRIHESDRSVREGAWNRLMGQLVREVTIGVIGVGRIGSRVVSLLQPFQPRILATDVNPAVQGTALPNVRWGSLDEVLSQADLITVHIPLHANNLHFINRARIARMKTGAMVINTSRGPVVDEEALADALRQRHLGGAALDVFAKEPYEGPLARLDNVVLTAHIGASANASRYLMELGAAEDCIRVLQGSEPEHDAIADELGAT
jgi:D-3-phosphoglycerate dehydrogenase